MWSAQPPARWFRRDELTRPVTTTGHRRYRSLNQSVPKGVRQSPKLPEGVRKLQGVRKALFSSIKTLAELKVDGGPWQVFIFTVNKYCLI